VATATGGDVTTYLGVCGWPVAHSRSPAMHNAALAAVGLHDWRYLQAAAAAAPVRRDRPRLPAAGFRGVNVTIPHKEAALALAGEASETARAIGAANTLTFAPDGTIHADNTDAPGCSRRSPVCPPAGRSALVLGAGGSARAAIWALRGAGARVSVWNRTSERARALAAELGARAVSTRSGPRSSSTARRSGSRPDATFKTLPLHADELDAGTCVVDMVYRDGGTKLLGEARSRGASVVDGLEILVAQGALSFERWTGTTAPRAAMREAATRSP
jgi:shikimate dehydrogenase